MTGTIKDSRTSKGYLSTIYKCAQDHYAFYCENGNEQSIFYDGSSVDMQINLLFKKKTEAFAFQNTLENFKFIHPTFGNKIQIDETVEEVHLPRLSKRVFHRHYAGADNNEPPVLSLADIQDVLSSTGSSVCYDPEKALQSLEDITIMPGMKYYWCHLVSRQVLDVKNNPNNCIWGSWIFHEYFDALNVQYTRIPFIAVRYVSTGEEAETISAGDKFLSRKRVNVMIEFHDSVVGRNAAYCFQPITKMGTEVVNDRRYSSFLYPENPDEFRSFLEQKYVETIDIWENED